MSGVAQHIDALIGGLLAVPDFRKNAGEAVWTYLALLKAANHRGVVCKRSDQITDMLQTDEATLLADCPATPSVPQLGDTQSSAPVLW